MSFERLRHTWETLGSEDPLWAVLSDPSKHNNKWDSAEFFETGKKEIDGLFSDLRSRGIEPNTRRCLDFGCGVGRLSQALGDYFDVVDGVDIAQSMIDAARRYNQHGSRCRYHVNAKDDLQLFGTETFDLVYSNIVLQHMETELAQRYIAEFMRVLAPGGLAVFQVPSRPRELPRVALTSFNAEIHVEGVPRFEGGERAVVSVEVRNTGSEVWPASGSIQVGNHWLDSHGSMLVLDDGRTPVAWDMKPGNQTALDIRVTAPQLPGQYLLELDLVQEGVAWFAVHGSSTARVTVDVVRPPLRKRALQQLRGHKRRIDGGGGEGAPAIMEMHAVPKERVISIVTAAGGEVIDIEDFDVSGPGWDSYKYFIRKS